MKPWLLILALMVPAQVSVKGGVTFSGGVTLNGTSGGGSSYWNPTAAFTDLTANNTSNCYPGFETCAPQVGTTSNQSTFPGMSETRFTGVSASSTSTLATLSIPAGQGCCTAGNTNGAYNFATTDHVVVSGLGPIFNGTQDVVGVTSGSPGKVTFTVSLATSASGGTIYRSNPTSFDQYIQPPANTANYTNDGVDIHDLVWPGYTGYVFFHFTPFQHCPSTGSCNFSPKPNITTNGSHVMVGYEGDNLNEVTAQYNAMLRLEAPGGKMGMVFDWSGGPVSGASSTRVKENATADLWATVVSGNSSNFVFTVAHDNSGWNTSAVATVCGDSSASVVNSKDPSCVERFLESSLQYEHTAKTAHYTSVLDGNSYSGSGYFANSAYLRDPATGQPLNFSFINGESSMFGGCTTSAPCAVYNAGVSGTTCTSSSDCWSKIKTGISNFISTWGTDKPLFLWRNTFTNNTVINAGDMDWVNPTGDASNEAFNTSRISQAGVGGTYASSIYIPFALAHLNHAQSSFQDDTFIVGGRCGQTFVDWMSKIYTYGSGAYFGPGVKTPLGIQIGTWNDHEEGTAVEPGIPICYGITASLSGSIVSWSLTTSDSTYASTSSLNGTLDHVALLAVKTGGAIGGNDTQILATASAASSGTFDLSTINMDPGAYTVYVKLIPKALMQTKTTAGMSYTR